MSKCSVTPPDAFKLEAKNVLFKFGSDDDDPAFKQITSIYLYRFFLT